jgi:23S rRNA (uracil1939-C5)-methyltransferase
LRGKKLFVIIEGMSSINCIHAQNCGNCSTLSLTQAEKEEQKRSWLANFLRFPTLQLVPSPKQKNYRSRISMRPNKLGELGYFKPRSHDHVPISECSIAHQAINQALKALPPLPFPAKSVELRSNGEQVLLNIQSQKGHRPKKQALEKWIGDAVHGLGFDGHPMVGQKKLSFQVCGVEHQISLGSFYQTNPEVNELLVQTIIDWTLEHQAKKVLDLYCGAGNIGCAIAKQGVPVIGIESSSSSVQDGKATIKRHQLEMEIRKADADKFQAGDAYFDLAVLDPPRKGAGQVIKELRYTNPKALIYVSCNPHALRKDLGEAKKWGYKPTRMIAFDMFPHTQHVETLVELRK